MIGILIHHRPLLVYCPHPGRIKDLFQAVTVFASIARRVESLKIFGVFASSSAFSLRFLSLRVSFLMVSCTAETFLVESVIEIVFKATFSLGSTFCACATKKIKIENNKLITLYMLPV
ncbi:hypothetical protein D3C87_1483510 [compost metagenome]